MQASNKLCREFNPILQCSSSCAISPYSSYLYFSFISLFSQLISSAGSTWPQDEKSGWVGFLLPQNHSHSSQPSAPTRCCNSQPLTLNLPVLGSCDISGRNVFIFVDQWNLWTQVSQGSHRLLIGLCEIQRVLTSLARLKLGLYIRGGSCA